MRANKLKRKREGRATRANAPKYSDVMAVRDKIMCDVVRMRQVSDTGSCCWGSQAYKMELKHGFECTVFVDSRLASGLQAGATQLTQPCNCMLSRAVSEQAAHFQTTNLLLHKVRTI